MVPPDLPGAQEPPIKLPKFTKENMAQRKEILAKLYPPLPVMAPEPVLASGPDGKTLLPFRSAENCTYFKS